MILEQTGVLVVLRCWCGVQHAVPESLRNEQMRQFNDGMKPTGIYCPLGHSHVPSGTTKADRIERELLRTQQRLDQAKAEIRDQNNKINAQKAAKSRLKNRIAKGVCPCCNRSFVNLQQHMAGQHPDFVSSQPDA